MHNKTALERAFELADIGIALPDIRATIRKEGYDPNALHGMTVTIQLGRRIVAAKDAIATQTEVGDTADRITRAPKKKR